MSTLTTPWLGDWRRLVEKPTAKSDLEQMVEAGSAPSFPFFFMLTASAIIATLGLLADSAAVIIGAMIVAPLMHPVVSLAYGLTAAKGQLAVRSLVTLIAGTVLTVLVALVITEAIGWNVAGHEILSRTRPTLLDLGVAAAAGAAAAYAYTRPGVSSALAGIAIAVALVPPLCTVGIALALGRDVSAEAGLVLDGLGARGPLLLYVTNLIGIIFAASVVFYRQYFRKRVWAIFALLLTLVCLVLVVPPLGIAMDNLLIRNQVRRSLTVIARPLLPSDDAVRLTNLAVQVQDEVVFVRADVIAAPAVITDSFVDAVRGGLSELVERPVELEVGIIRETVVRATE